MHQQAQSACVGMSTDISWLSHCLFEDSRISLWHDLWAIELPFEHSTLVISEGRPLKRIRAYLYIELDRLLPSAAQDPGFHVVGYDLARCGNTQWQPS